MKLSEHVRATHGQDGAVVLDIVDGRLFRLNLIGSRVLELLKQGCTEPQITEQLSQECGVEPATVAIDVHDFFEQLRQHRLLTNRQESASHVAR